MIVELSNDDINLIETINTNSILLNLNKILRNDNLKDDIFEEYDKEDRQVLKKEKDGIIIPENEENKKKEFLLMQCKKTFLDLMTSMVAKEVCFNDKYQNYVGKFQFIVNKVYEENISNYMKFKINKGAKLNDNDILFLYKGGTTMKIVYEKYKKILKDNGFDDLFDNLIKYFERSDSDYSILINPNLTKEKNNISFEEVYYDINILSYNCLDLLRNIFYSFKNKFVPLHMITNEILKDKINEMNNVLEQMKTNSKECTNVNNIKEFIGLTFMDRNVFLKNIDKNIVSENIDLTFSSIEDGVQRKKYKDFIKNGYISSKTNDFIMSLTNDGKKYYRQIQKKEKKDIYLSLNESNEYNNNGALAYFSLHRLKINFVAYYIANNGKVGFFYTPSELVDVSILKKQASGLTLFYNHANMEYMNYNYENPKLKFNFKSYSIYGHINDLIFTLFDVSEYPWDDAKYKKRIKRLMFFVLLELAIHIKDNDILKKLFISIKSINKNNRNISEISNIKQIINKYNYHLASINFFEKLEKLVKNAGNNLEYKTKYDEFFSEINTIINYINLNNLNSNILKNLKEDNKIVFLGGDYYRKYLKYTLKNKNE